MKKTLIAIGVFLVLASLYLNFGKQAEPLAPNSQSAKLLKHGPYEVRSEKVSLTDDSRGIQQNGDYEGSETREFTVFVWSPKTKPSSPQPLVVYSHGFMSNGQGGEHLAILLASHGYTVASATYPLTHYGAPGGPNPQDVVNQPDDISFIIDTLLEQNTDPADELFEHIDPARIAAVGMSLGGMTTELVAFHPLNADKRISAAVSIAGPAYMFGMKFFAERNIPFMMIASPFDAMIAYNDNAANIPEKVAGSVLVTVENASHTGFSGGAKWLRWMDNPDSLGCKTVMDRVSNVEEEEDWYRSIGGVDIGVLAAQQPPMCVMDPLPKTMNPLRQLHLVDIAVRSFLGCHYSIDAGTASDNCRFLSETFEQEIAEVSVTQ